MYLNLALRFFAGRKETYRTIALDTYAEGWWRDGHRFFILFQARWEKS